MTVTGYLQSDHVRLDTLIDEVRTSLGARAFARARGLLLEVTRGLSRHIDAEEQILFPAFERATRMTGGPTAVMRREHVDIRRLLDAVLVTLEAEAEAPANAAIDELVEVLGAHNRKEEHVLYPMTDRALPPKALEELLDRLRASLGDVA